MEVVVAQVIVVGSSAHVLVAVVEVVIVAVVAKAVPLEINTGIFC